MSSHEINRTNPGRPVKGGVQLTLHWNAIENVLREQGIFHGNETITGIRVTDSGITFQLERKGC